MNFQHSEYWPALLLFFIVFLTVTIILERRFFKVIKTYWFHERSLWSYFSTLSFLSGVGLLLFAMLDIRGPEEKIKTSVPSDRTIILLDTSASMLAEDVKPSRLQKAVLIAKHFARRAAGHQISIVAFSEIQKKIVPFTNDLDLIDARLESLKNLRNQYGSSALSMAIQESIQYFRETGDSAQGNILILTDGEETAGSISLNIPKDVRIALVGIGTTQGGRIPLDDSRGLRFGYKKDRGRDIITKLNESFFKNTVNDIASSKYWLTNTYSLPTDEVLAFFKSEKGKGIDQQDMVIRPVLMEWFVIPAIILFILAYFFKAIRVFAFGLLLIIGPTWGHEKEPEFSPEMIERLEQLQRGKLDHLERLKLADDLYKDGLKPEALTLYTENLEIDQVDSKLPAEAYLNYGTALLEKGATSEGLKTYENLLNSLEADSQKSSEIKEIVKKNITKHFQLQEQKEQQKKDQENQKKKQEKKEQEGQEGQQGKDSGEQSGQGQENKKSGKPQKGDEEKKDKDQGQDKDKDKDKDKDEDKNDGEEKSENEKEDKSDDGDKGEPKNLPPKKLPAKLKQLLSDDRQLQMRVIENGTRDLNKRKSRTSKDW